MYEIIFSAVGVKCHAIPLKVSPYFSIAQLIFFGPLGSMSSLIKFPNTLYRLKGMNNVAAHE